jgi:hypothetical protein
MCRARLASKPTVETEPDESDNPAAQKITLKPEKHFALGACRKYRHPASHHSSPLENHNWPQQLDKWARQAHPITTHPRCKNEIPHVPEL